MPHKPILLVLVVIAAAGLTVLVAAWASSGALGDTQAGAWALPAILGVALVWRLILAGGGGR